MSVRVLLACVLALSAASCRQIVGIEQREEPEKPGPCEACREERCNVETVACNGKTPCRTRFDCFKTCAQGDAACISQCDISRSTPEFQEIAALRACEATRCPSECASTCSDLPVVAPSSAAVACRTCVTDKCCDPAGKCLQNVDCLGIDECTRGHVAPADILACRQSVAPDDTADYEALEACLEKNCGVDCDIGSYWPCLGKVTWPQAEKETIRIGIRVIDNFGSKPIEGLDLKACLLTDADCDKPLTSTSTNVDGLVYFDADTKTAAGLVGFTGFLEITDPKGSYLPTLVFANPPIVRDNSVHDVFMGSKFIRDSLLKQAGVTPEPGRGDVVLSIVDCANRPAFHVSLAAEPNDEKTAVRYSLLFGVSPTNTSTDRYGTGFVFNALPGPMVVTGKLAATGQTLGTVTVAARAGWITEVLLSPSP